jgi:uncharacterized protein (DUF169 family)
METALRDKFISLWEKYFCGGELPIAFYYADRTGGAARPKPPTAHRCVIGDLTRVRRGAPLCFDVDAIGCSGGQRYFGFAHELRPKFEYFLSYGIPGELEGERYKKSPELVKEVLQQMPRFEAPREYIVFKRWDNLEEADEPEVVIFFAQADVLSGLFTLANFDAADPNRVFAPFCAGCASIVQYPYLERESERPRAVLGMFDVSARPFVPKDKLTFAVPMKRFVQLIDNMEESFLITASWRKIQKRICG